MKSKKLNTTQELDLPDFGSVYTTKGSQYLYLSFYYFSQRLRFPTDRMATPKNRHELRKFMNKVGERIRNRTFCFAKTFYWLDETTKAYFSELEGREVRPEPEHVTFSEYAEQWMATKIPKFASVTKQRDYRDPLNSRILPYFGAMTFAQITATAVETFIDNLNRAIRTKKPDNAASLRNGKPLSPKRINNIIGPMKKVWLAACNDNNWNLRDPFTGVPEKLKELQDQAITEKERAMVLLGDDECGEESRREVFLLKEWQQLLACIDPHYHLVMDLLLMGMIGSELEALLKHHVKEPFITIRCAITRHEGEIYCKLKPKNWYRKRQIPITKRLRVLLEKSIAVSTNPALLEFANDITLPVDRFVLTMKDGSPFNYDSFRKTVWDRALKMARLEMKVPYAARHSFVQWSLIIGISKERLVSLMGHSTKKMVDEVYGRYRDGLIEEKEKILEYFGEDFLALEELKLSFPERYRRIMAEV